MPTARCQGCSRELPDDSAVLPEDRPPCPNCGSTSRRYEIALEGKLGLSRRLDARAAPATLEAAAQIIPASIVAEVNPGVLELLLEELGDVSRVLTWTDLPEGKLLAEVRDEKGSLIGSGLGDDWADAILELADHLKPPGR